MMHSTSLFSFVLSLCLISTTFPTSKPATLVTSAFPYDVINETCMKCSTTAQSSIFSYSFCLNSLQAVSASRATNLEGLAIISMELSIENASNIVTDIKTLLAGEGLDPLTMSGLEDCLVLYSQGVEALTYGVGSFLMGEFNAAELKVNEALDASNTCHEGFTKKGRDAPFPLITESEDFFRLCEMALCMIHLLGTKESYCEELSLKI